MRNFLVITELKTKRSQIDNTLRFRVNANETIGINEFLEEHRNCCRDYLGKEFFFQLQEAISHTL